MSLEGMDVDQAQSLARQLSGHAQALAHISATLTALAAELSHSWQGPASATFQQHWTAQYRPALGQAAQALADMHAHLVANIQQQVRTSDTDPGPSLLADITGGILGGVTVAGVLSGISRGWNDLQDVAGWEGLVQTPLDKVKDLADLKYVANAEGEEKYGEVWTQLIQLDQDSSFLKYEESPILNALTDNPGVQRAGEILRNAHATAVLGTLDTAGKALGDVTTAVDGGEAVYALSQGHYGDAASHAVDATSDALMNTDNPVTFLAGFDIKLLKTDYQLGSQIDWSQGIPNPLNATTFREDYIPTFKALPGQLVSTLAGIFR